MTTTSTNWILLCLRAIEVWLLMSVAEVIHGVGRVIFLQPIIGDFRARQIAVFTGSLLILTIAFLFRRWIDGSGLREYLVVGALWTLLTIAFEIVLGRFFMGLTSERIISDYDVANGGLMLFGLGVLFLAPLIVSRIDVRRSRSGAKAKTATRRSSQCN